MTAEAEDYRAARGGQLTCLTHFQLSDLLAMHLVRAVGKAQGAHAAPHVGQLERLAHGTAAVGLHRVVNDLQTPCSAPRP